MLLNIKVIDIIFYYKSFCDLCVMQMVRLQLTVILVYESIPQCNQVKCAVSGHRGQKYGGFCQLVTNVSPPIDIMD